MCNWLEIHAESGCLNVSLSWNCHLDLFSKVWCLKLSHGRLQLIISTISVFCQQSSFDMYSFACIRKHTKQNKKSKSKTKKQTNKQTKIKKVRAKNNRDYYYYYYYYYFTIISLLECMTGFLCCFPSNINQPHIILQYLKILKLVDTFIGNVKISLECNTRHHLLSMKKNKK